MFTRRLNLCCFAANSPPEEDVHLIIILMAQQRASDGAQRPVRHLLFLHPDGLHKSQ